MKKLRPAGLALLLALTSAFSALAAPAVPPAGLRLLPVPTL